MVTTDQAEKILMIVYYYLTLFKIQQVALQGKSCLYLHDHDHGLTKF